MHLGVIRHTPEVCRAATGVPLPQANHTRRRTQEQPHPAAQSPTPTPHLAVAVKAGAGHRHIAGKRGAVPVQLPIQASAASIAAEEQSAHRRRRRCTCEARAQLTPLVGQAVCMQISLCACTVAHLRRHIGRCIGGWGVE